MYLTSTSAGKWSRLCGLRCGAGNAGATQASPIRVKSCVPNAELLAQRCACPENNRAEVQGTRAIA